MSAVVVELRAVSGFADFEALAVARPPTIVGLLQLTPRFLRVAGGFGRTGEIVIGTPDRFF